MNTTHHTIALAGAAAGQRLAEPVLDERGNVLVGADCEITEAVLQALARRGVTELCVARTEVVDETEAAARRARAAARVAHLFRHAMRQGRLNPLMHSVLQYRQARS